MNKSTRRTRRHRNPRQAENEQKPFFTPTHDTAVQAKEESSFFQARLDISPSNDPAEKEADSVANQVVKGVQQSRTDAVQRKESVSRMEQEEPQAKLNIQRMGEEEEPAAKIQRMDKEEPQAKLNIQRMGEEEEPAAKIQRMDKEEPQAKLNIQLMGEEEEPAAKIQRMDKEEPQAKLNIQRMGEEEEPAAKIQRMDKEKPQAKLNIQRMGEEEEPAAKKESSDATTTSDTKNKQKPVLSPLEAMIRETKGQGFALPEDTRVELEAQFGADFSKVRIHTDSAAVRMCQMINAQAFTHGYDIYFNSGKYNPDTETGQNLLAHELTHVVQQKGN